MKKLFFTLYLLVGLLISQSVASATMVRIADVGAESLVSKIQSIIASKSYNVRVTDAWRSRDMDIVKDHLYGWRCKYGIKNASSPEGDIVFWANEQGYVQGLRIIYNKSDLDNANSSFRILFEKVILQSIGFTENDIANIKFYRQEEGHINGFYVNNRNHRHYCIMLYPRIRTDGSNIADFGMNIWANTDVNDPISISQEVLTNESYDNGSLSQ